MKNIFSNQTTRSALFVVAGLFLGWIFFHSSPKVEKGVEVHNHSAEKNRTEVWTCSMHPQIRMDKPGKCPICGMDLILLNSNSSVSSDPMAIHLTKEAAQLANVLTSIVSSQKPVKEVRLYGKVQADERLLQSQVTYISGRIEKLMVNFTGETVRKGQTLAVIYSPELLTAQQELIEAARTKQSQPEIYEASKEKLRQWKLTPTQITSIEQSGQVQANMEIASSASGIVTARRVNNGDYVSQGSVLYEVSDLSRVWVLFDAYESDLSFLEKGDQLDFTLQAMPGSTYSGVINFIDPVIDPVNRVAKVRVEINNPGGKLKPEMFATGMVKANLDEYKDKLVIPRSSVLWTGKRSIVYVKQPGDEPIFKIREIGLGPVLGNSYVVTDGLEEGEEIVTEGAFSVDAAAQLEGKPSMMNQSGGKKASSMPGMVMPGDNNSEGSATANAKPTDSKDMSGMDMGSVVHSNDNKSMPGKDMSKVKMETQKIKVSGNCDLCKERIETAAKSVSGVMTAGWSAEKQMLNVEFDPSKTNSDDIQKAIAKVGHDTEKYKAKDAAYKALPECCLYRK